MAQWGPPPIATVAHLGVNIHEADPAALPAGLLPADPYFVTLGTIEPRKGHDLLLDVWEVLARQIKHPPTLLICGTRGWNNRAVFDRLDRLPSGGPVREMAGLTDGAVAALVSGAQAMLCPSRAEGFGLPAVEAAARGVPVICNDLPVYREVIGNTPIYLAETCRYQWADAIRALTNKTTTTKSDASHGVFVAPRWQDHFRVVLESV
ncbi:glycosyltransferase [Pontibaca sp. S1109L]|uniref:Glycosyltransferase n=2 Tax=Pontibaca salina TaxID=2795731 RepID=A0A934HN72_9RHOB|nr:glycosyltransferase [Pontibaca salina]MBI6628462.1 glycosyltransferase [Pontibaca salina]